MGKIILKKDVKITLDRDRKVVRILSPINRMSKITGRHLPNLLGENIFNSVGASILDRLGLLEFVDTTDPYYKLRGAIAEEIVFNYLKESYEKASIPVELKKFESQVTQPNGQTYGNDLFKNNQRFGGVIDIAIAKPDKIRAVVEVKSKDIKNKHYIFKNDGTHKIPLEELRQGQHYCVLSKVPKLLMAYVFFNQQQESDLRSVLEKDGFQKENIVEIMKQFDITHKTVDIQIYKEIVDFEKVKALQEEAYAKLNGCFENKEIPFDYFSDKELFELEGVDIEPVDIDEEIKDAKTIVSEDDLPF
jgi:hypothetical protein